MNNISAKYALDVAQHMSLVGVFLGGVSITLLITLVVINKPGKLINWMVGVSALAACVLLISVVSSLRLLIALHPEFPSSETTSPEEISLLWKSMVASYGIGVLCLAFCIGLSGWFRSVKTGIITLAFAAFAVFFFVSTSVFS